MKEKVYRLDQATGEEAIKSELADIADQLIGREYGKETISNARRQFESLLSKLEAENVR